jgi:hypothetical protein
VRVGFIFECGPKEADVQVCETLVCRLRPEIEFVSRTLDNKPNLVWECGPVARVLLQDCEQVIIIWDLFPPWRETAPCLHQDRVDIFQSLQNEVVDKSKVSLVCVHEELEAWLLADKRALQTVIARFKHPHKVGRIKNYSSPDSIQKPKTKLNQLFQYELGRGRRYNDFQHAKMIVEAIPDFQRIRRSGSFLRFRDVIIGC